MTRKQPSLSASSPQFSAEFTIGSFHVAAVSDGVPERNPGKFFAGIDPALWASELGLSGGDDVVPFNYGAFLVRDGRHTILIDSGMGPGVFEEGTPGKDGLLDRIEQLGVKPQEIDIVFHTHLHRDHVGWNVTGEAGAELEHFPNATITVAQRELDYWLHPAVVGTERGQTAIRSIASAMAAGRLQTFDGECEIAPGFKAIPTPGHTPGHASVLLTSRSENLLILGDLTHHVIGLQRHDWVTSVDVDPSETTRSRKMICEMALALGALVTSHHFPIPTIGRINRVASGYEFEPMSGTDSGE